MKPHSMQTLVAAALAAIAFNIGVGAQTTTFPATGAAATQPNGTQEPTSPGSYQSGTSMSPSNSAVAPGARQPMTSEDVRQYLDARKACGSQPMAQRPTCDDAVNERFTGVDSKCQKLSGLALEECLHGADRGS